MNHLRIIDNLGGYLAVARALRVGPHVAWRWGRERAIPARRWPAVVKLAKAQGRRDVTFEALALGYGPAQRQPAEDALRKREARAARAAA